MDSGGVNLSLALSIQYWSTPRIRPSLLERWVVFVSQRKERDLEIWIDGELKGTNDAYKLGIPDAAYQALLIGANSWHGDIHGIMDEFRVSDMQRNSGFLLSIGVEPKDKVATTWCWIKNQR